MKMKDIEKIPIGLLSALTESKSAMRRFCRMSKDERARLAETARSIRDREDMRVLALSLATDQEPLLTEERDSFI